MIIEKIRKYMLGCPLLDEFGKINVDYLGVNPTEYTIDSQPTTETLKEYVDGGKLKQYVFVFGSREYYGPDEIQNIENSGFYEKLSDWFHEQSEKGELPLLDDNKRAIKIEALTTGYLFDATEDNARYQIQARLIYYED